VAMRLMVASLRTAEPSDEELEVVDAVARRSISWLGRPCGVLMKRSGLASRSFLSISRSASFILAVLVVEENTGKKVREVQFAQLKERAAFLFLFILLCCATAAFVSKVSTTEIMRHELRCGLLLEIC